MNFQMRAAAALAATGLLAAMGRADEFAFDPTAPPSAEAFAQGETERLDAVRRQIQLNDAMRRRAGFPPANGVFYYPSPPYEPGFAFFRRYPFRFTPTVKQPLGRIEIQAGPNRWESHPVYAAPPAAQHEAIAPIPNMALPPSGGPREF